jgi:hypothetical protein
MNEDSLWLWLRDIALPLGHYSRIESAHTAPGFPDVAYQLAFGMGLSGTLELKYSKNKEIPFLHPPGKPGMRKTQLTWIKKEVEYNGYVFIIAEAPPEIYVIPGNAAAEINGATREKLSKISVGILNREDSKNSYHQLHNILTTWRYDK